MCALHQFISQIKARSTENRKAFEILYPAETYGVCIGLLRQELDTLIRLCYLWHPDTSSKEALKLIELSVQGEEWGRVNAKGKKIRIQDREMINLAEHLGGWEQLIYNIGCKLIHLSKFHLYKTEDPVALLSQEDQDAIAGYLTSYHGYEGGTISMKIFVQYMPNVMEKLFSNVEFYMEELESGWLEKKSN